MIRDESGISDARPARWQRLESIFHAALAYAEPDWRRFVEDATQDDPSLRAEVMALIQAHRQGTSLFEHAAFEIASHVIDNDAEVELRRIGPYRIIRMLGRGGMGVVYEAEQQHPKRSVALKVLQAGEWVDRQRLKLFEREIQTLARLKDSRIADIYEAGYTEDGRPYFAMELISGCPLDEYVRQYRPALSARLGLFLQICDAVIHAHQRGVIHRDLKPSNILVAARDGDAGGSPVPLIKVLDFGLARIVDHDSTSSQTMTGHVMGTLAYMSPEQLRWSTRDEIDVRSDVYALGVILFELLAERLPCGQRTLLPHEMAREVCEAPPRRLGAVRVDLRGDLETINAKALEKDASRRYQSVSELAADIRHYLGNEPISARPASTWYVTRRFVKRNKGLVGAVCLCLLALLGSAVVSLWQARKARQANVLAQTRLAETRQVADFLEDMIGAVEPESVGRQVVITLLSEAGDESLATVQGLFAELNPTEVGRRVLYQSILHPAGGAIDEEFADQPLVRGELLAKLGNTLVRIGDYRHAEQLLTRARDIVSGHSVNEYAFVSTVQRDLAILRHKQARWDEAEALFREAVDTQRRLLGGSHRETLRTRGRLALLYHDQNRFDESDALLSEVLSEQVRQWGNEDSDALETLHNLAILYQSRGQFSKAEELYLQTLSRLHSRFGRKHIAALTVASRLGSLYRAMKRLDEAEEIIADTLDLQQEVLGEEHPDTLVSLAGLAELRHYQGQYEQAEEMYRRVARAQVDQLGPEHPDTLATQGNLAMVLADQGHFSASEALFKQVIGTSRAVLGLKHALTLSAMENLALCHEQQREYNEASVLLEEALGPLRETLGESHGRTIAVAHRLAQVCIMDERFRDSRDLLGELLVTMERSLGKTHPQTLKTLKYLGDSYAMEGDLDTAHKVYTELLDLQTQLYGADDSRLLPTMAGLGMTLTNSGQCERAEPILAHAVAIARGELMGDDYLTGMVLGRYGECLIGLQRYHDGEKALLESYDILARTKGAGHEETVQVIGKIVDLYRALEDRAEIDHWEATLQAALRAGPPNSRELGGE